MGVVQDVCVNDLQYQEQFMTGLRAINQQYKILAEKRPKAQNLLMQSEKMQINNVIIAILTRFVAGDKCFPWNI